MTTETGTTDYLSTPLGELPVTFRNLSAEVTVPSSKPGQFYTVSVTKSFAQCTCPGFHYRGQCKHVKMIKAVLGA